MSQKTSLVIPQTNDRYLVEDAIVTAVDYLTTKIEKHHQKHCKNEKKSLGCMKGTEICCKCDEMKSQIEGGSKSPLLSTPSNRKLIRREGVAEQNETERLLTKEAVKVMAKTVNMAQHEIILI